jgi:hypothetical protein
MTSVVTPLGDPARSVRSGALLAAASTRQQCGAGLAVTHGLHRATIARSPTIGIGRHVPPRRAHLAPPSGLVRTFPPGPYLQGRCRGFESLRAHRGSPWSPARWPPPASGWSSTRENPRDSAGFRHGSGRSSSHDAAWIARFVVQDACDARAHSRGQWGGGGVGQSPSTAGWLQRGTGTFIPP